MLDSQGRKLYVYLPSAREDEQSRIMRECQERGICPLCPEAMAEYDYSPKLWKGRHWLIKENQYPYDHTKLHVLLVPFKHMETLADISPDAWSELGEALKWVEEKYGVESGVVAMRFGELGYNGSTLAHLHIHIIVGDHDAPDFKTVRFKVAQRVEPAP